MLVLSRKSGESLLIGNSIEITILRISGNRVSVGIHADPKVRVLRSELSHHDGLTDAEAESRLASAHHASPFDGRQPSVNHVV